MPVKFEELEKSNVEPDLEEKLPEGFEEGDEKNEKMDDDDDDKDDPEENEDEMCASCQQMGLMEKIKKWIPKPLDKIFAICEFFSVDTKEEKIRKEKTMSGYAMYLVYFGYAFLFFAAEFVFGHQFEKQSIQANRHYVFKASQNKFVTAFQDVVISIGANNFWDTIKFSPFKTFEKKHQKGSTGFIGHSQIDLRALLDMPSAEVKKVLKEKVFFGTGKDLIAYYKSMFSLKNYFLYQNLQKYVLNREVLQRNGVLTTAASFLVAYLPWMIWIASFVITVSCYRLLTVLNPGYVTISGEPTNPNIISATDKESDKTDEKDENGFKIVQHLANIDCWVREKIGKPRSASIKNIKVCANKKEFVTFNDDYRKYQKGYERNENPKLSQKFEKLTVLKRSAKPESVDVNTYTVEADQTYSGSKDAQDLIRVKFCRASGDFVAKFDHWCFWIGRAVGEKNHLLFVIFLIACTFFLLFSAAGIFSTIVLGHLFLLNNFSIFNMLYHVVYAWGGFFVICIVLLMPLPLCVHHIYLATTNQTSYELYKPFKLDYLRFFNKKIDTEARFESFLSKKTEQDQKEKTNSSQNSNNAPKMEKESKSKKDQKEKSNDPSEIFIEKIDIFAKKNSIPNLTDDEYSFENKLVSFNFGVLSNLADLYKASSPIFFHKILPSPLWPLFSGSRKQELDDSKKFYNWKVRKLNKNAKKSMFWKVIQVLCSDECAIDDDDDDDFIFASKQKDE